LNTDSEPLPMTDAGSEFQTDGAAHRKERFAKSVHCCEACKSCSQFLEGSPIKQATTESSINRSKAS